MGRECGGIAEVTGRRLESRSCLFLFHQVGLGRIDAVRESVTVSDGSHRPVETMTSRRANGDYVFGWEFGKRSVHMAWHGKAWHGMACVTDTSD